MDKLNIAIVGGGITGLTAAYRLSATGCKVTILEKDKNLGGLAGSFKIGKTDLEKTYHHIFRTDEAVIELAKELGITKRLNWLQSSIGLYYGGKIYPFVTPIDLLKFEPLGLADKLRLGLVGLYLQKDNNWQKYKKVKAWEWMRRWAGQKAYEAIWEPLLKGKFHDRYKQVSMAWLWARIHTRGNSKERGEASEKLGYFDGGFNILVKALAEAIKKNCGVIRLGTEVKNIKKGRRGKLIVETDKKLEFDRVIAAIPSNILAKMLKLKDKDYLRKLESIEYLGALTLIFETKQNLSKYYWHNINDLSAPFLAFIQQTNLIDKKNYDGKHVYYMGTYLPQGHRYYQDRDETIWQEWGGYLKKVFPKFELKEVKKYWIFREKFGQHLVTCDYEEKIPDHTTPLPGLYHFNYCQIFPEDRGINYAVREGNKAAEMILGS